MKVAIVIAVIAATPPTLAAMLAFFTGRASDRAAASERAAVVSQALEHLGLAVDRVEAGVGRVEAGVVELRERVARLEGAGSAAPIKRG
jgi:hypothetical protein